VGITTPTRKKKLNVKKPEAMSEGRRRWRGAVKAVKAGKGLWYHRRRRNI
jgi:hypothetical protein